MVKHILALLLAALLLGGCYAYDTSITLNPDGSGTLEVTVGVNKAYEQQQDAEQGIVHDTAVEIRTRMDDAIEVDRADFIERWQATITDWDDGTYAGARLTMQFRDVAMLEEQLTAVIEQAGTMSDYVRSVEVSQARNQIYLGASIEGRSDTIAEEQLEDGTIGVGRLGWSVTLPQADSFSPAEFARQTGGRVAWSFPLSELPEGRTFTLDVNGQLGVLPQQAATAQPTAAATAAPTAQQAATAQPTVAATAAPTTQQAATAQPAAAATATPTTGAAPTALPAGSTSPLAPSTATAPLPMATTVGQAPPVATNAPVASASARATLAPPATVAPAVSSTAPAALAPTQASTAAPAATAEGALSAATPVQSASVVPAGTAVASLAEPSVGPTTGTQAYVPLAGVDALAGSATNDLAAAPTQVRSLPYRNQVIGLLLAAAALCLGSVGWLRLKRRHAAAVAGSEHE